MKTSVKKTAKDDLMEWLEFNLGAGENAGKKKWPKRTHQSIFTPEEMEEYRKGMASGKYLPF